MKNYLLIWRFFPKLFFGTIFIVEILILTIGTGMSLELTRAVFDALKASFSGATLLILSVVLIAILSNMGIFFLGFLSSAIGGILSKPIAMLSPKIPEKVLFVKDLVEPQAELAFRRLRDDPHFYLDFFKLRSLASCQLQQKKQIESFLKQVSDHVSTIKNPREAEATNYYCALSQDQRSFDLNNDELQSLWNLLIIFLVGIPVFLTSELDKTTILTAMILILTFTLLTLMVLVHRKRYFAILLIGSYLDNFALGPPADIADREGEAIL